MTAANKRAKDFLKTFFRMYYLPNGVLVNTLPELKKFFLFKYGDRAHYPESVYTLHLTRAQNDILVKTIHVSLRSFTWVSLHEKDDNRHNRSGF